MFDIEDATVSDLPDGSYFWVGFGGDSQDHKYHKYYHFESDRMVIINDQKILDNLKSAGCKDVFKKDGSSYQWGRWHDLTEEQKTRVGEIYEIPSSWRKVYFPADWKAEIEMLKKEDKTIEDLKKINVAGDGFYQVIGYDGNLTWVRNLDSSDIIWLSGKVEGSFFCINDKITHFDWDGLPGEYWKSALREVKLERGSPASFPISLVDKIEDLPYGNYQELWYQSECYAVRELGSGSIFYIDSHIKFGIQPFFEKNSSGIHRFNFEDLSKKLQHLILKPFKSPPGTSKIDDPVWADMIKIWTWKQLEKMPAPDFFLREDLLVGSVSKDGVSYYIYQDENGDFFRTNDLNRNLKIAYESGFNIGNGIVFISGETLLEEELADEKEEKRDSELLEAGYRIAAIQVKKLLQGSHLSSLLTNEIGMSILSLALGYGLGQMEDGRVRRLGEEFRVSALASVGNEIINQLFFETVEQLRILEVEEIEEVEERGKMNYVESL